MVSKRYKKLPEKTNQLEPQLIEKLISEVKKNCTTKFDESIDLNLQINNKQKKNEINLRTVVNLPAGSGKKIKVAVVCEEAKSENAKNAGADLVGAEDFIEKIKAGELNFEKLICTPSMMIKLSKLGKILGPKGLMPNPKLGTVTDNLEKAIEDLITNKDERLKLGSLAKKYALEKRSNTVIVKSFLKIINNDIPKNWWFDPKEINFVFGSGQTQNETRNIVRTLISKYGDTSLNLDHNQALKKSFLELTKNNN